MPEIKLAKILLATTTVLAFLMSIFTGWLQLVAFLFALVTADRISTTRGTSQRVYVLLTYLLIVAGYGIIFYTQYNMTGISGGPEVQGGYLAVLAIVLTLLGAVVYSLIHFGYKKLQK